MAPLREVCKFHGMKTYCMQVGEQGTLVILSELQKRDDSIVLIGSFYSVLLFHLIAHNIPYYVS